MFIKVLDQDIYHKELEDGFRPRQEGDAGIDLRSTRDVHIVAHKIEVIPLGVAIQLPPLTVGWLTGRSSLTTAFGLLTHEGKIDQGYRGEIHCMVQAGDRAAHIKGGERICQLIVVPIGDPMMWTLSENLDHTTRGTSGLGSTGRV